MPQTKPSQSSQPQMMMAPQSELHFSCLSTLHAFTMLTLNPNTLFYWNLSDVSKKCKFNSFSVLKWTKSIQQNTTVHSRASVSSLSSTNCLTPTVTNQSTIDSNTSETCTGNLSDTFSPKELTYNDGTQSLSQHESNILLGKRIIWDHLFTDIPQEIMTTSVIYHLVLYFFFDIPNVYTGYATCCGFVE